MFDHVKFGVRDFALSKTFYLKALEPIGVTVVTESRHQVDAFYLAVLGAGGLDNGPPGLRPEYSGLYDAAFVLDLDGHNIEVVCHETDA